MDFASFSTKFSLKQNLSFSFDAADGFSQPFSSNRGEFTGEGVGKAAPF